MNGSACHPETLDFSSHELDLLQIMEGSGAALQKPEIRSFPLHWEERGAASAAFPLPHLRLLWLGQLGCSC